MFVFGSGVLIGTPQGGTPINFGLAQEISLNVATSTKALYGQYNFPVAIGSGTRKMTGKAKLARISGQALGSLFFGVTPSVGATQTQFGEATSVPSSSPYTYTTSLHTTFVADQGVVYAASALPLKQVASSPTTGQYSVSAGVYTFAAGDAGAAVAISYGYVPQDIAQAALELAAERFRAAERIGLRSKSLGGQETIAYDTSAISAPVLALLQPYRRVAV